MNTAWGDEQTSRSACLASLRLLAAASAPDFARSRALCACCTCAWASSFCVPASTPKTRLRHVETHGVPGRVCICIDVAIRAIWWLLALSLSKENVVPSSWDPLQPSFSFEGERCTIQYRISHGRDKLLELSLNRPFQTQPLSNHSRYCKHVLRSEGAS